MSSRHVLTAPPLPPVVGVLHVEAVVLAGRCFGRKFYLALCRLDNDGVF